MDSNIHPLHFGVTKIKMVYEDIGRPRQVLDGGTLYTT